MMFRKEIVESRGQKAITEVEEEDDRYEEDREAYQLNYGPDDSASHGGL